MPLRNQTTKSKHTYSVEAVVSFIQSPEKIISLNPLVTSFHQIKVLPTAPQLVTYGITDKLTLLGFIHTTTRYTVTFRNCDRGVDTEAKAAIGVIARSRWRVDEDGRVVEEGELEAPRMLMPYVNKEWGRSHRLIMDRLEEKLGTSRVALATEM